MADKALPVAVGIVRNGDRILLIRRVRGDYVGMWALPGGKIEAEEHLHQAVLRELREETGLELVFDSYLGVVSEIFTMEGDTKHFLLHICSLTANSSETVNTGEGDSRWFLRREIDDMAEEIIPSDYEIINNFLSGGGGYYSCRMTDREGKPVLERFERIQKVQG